MSPIKVTIHGSGTGTCLLTGKDSDSLTVTFEDGTVKEAFHSWKSFRQQLALKSQQSEKPAAQPKPTTVPAAAPANGPGTVK